MATKVTIKTKNENRGLTDLKVNPLNKTAAMPIVKQSVAEYIKAETESTKILEGGLWGVVDRSHECRFNHYLTEKDVKQMYKEEMLMRYPNEDITNKLRLINKAIRIAYGKTVEEVLIERKTEGFNAIYSECTDKTKSRKSRSYVAPTNKKDVRSKASDNGEQEQRGYNRFEEEEEKQRSAESGSLNAVVIRMISDNRLTPQMMVRAVSTYIADDLDATKEVICSLLEENEWCHEVAARYCKENPFSERDH
jgi:hypothetical protein